MLIWIGDITHNDDFSKYTVVPLNRTTMPSMALYEAELIPEDTVQLLYELIFEKGYIVNGKSYWPDTHYETHARDIVSAENIKYDIVATNAHW